MNPGNNNQQSASTTVGGVTFGGGSNSAAPVQNTTQASQMPVMQQAGQASADVDPIIQSTGDEFDSIMNGEAPAPAPAQMQQAPVKNVMETAVASPTHFDAQDTVKPIVVDPGMPGGFTRQQIQTEEEKTPEQVEKEALTKQVKKALTFTIIFGVLTAIFAILAFVGLVSGLNSQKEILELNTALDEKVRIIQQVEESTGVAPINKPEDVPVYKATTGYIYISDWGIKIKVTDNLDYVSYILNNNNYHQSICFNASQKGIQQYPDFASVALNPGRMGCLTRIPNAEGSFDPATGVSYGEKLHTFKDYSYFYTGPTDYSQDANLGTEHTVQQYIYSMLKDYTQLYE